MTGCLANGSERKGHLERPGNLTGSRGVRSSRAELKRVLWGAAGLGTGLRPHMEVLIWSAESNASAKDAPQGAQVQVRVIACVPSCPIEYEWMIEWRTCLFHALQEGRNRCRKPARKSLVGIGVRRRVWPRIAGFGICASFLGDLKVIAGT